MKCPVCLNLSASEEEIENAPRLILKVNCFRCGEYKANASFLHSSPENPTPEEIAKASGWVYNNPGIILDEACWNQIASKNNPSVGEKSDLLLLYLTKKFPKPNQELAFQACGQELSCCYAIDKDEASYIFSRYLKDYKHYISNPQHGGQPFVISPAGWDHIHELSRINSDSKKAFCAMWFDDSVKPLWATSISPAISELGYDPIRIDERQHNNKIDDEIITAIKKSRFIVADFSGNRGGVYFEAGYALGLNIPVIWMVRKKDLKKIHFDNRQYNFLVWEPNNLADLKQKLKARIEATVGLPK